jgi:hypothetical protein
MRFRMMVRGRQVGRIFREECDGSPQLLTVTVWRKECAYDEEEEGSAF